MTKIIASAFSIYLMTSCVSFAESSYNTNTIDGLHLEGAIGGVNFKRVIDSPEDDYEVPESNFSNTNGVYRFSIGYNHEISNLVLGLNIDMNFTNVSFESKMSRGSLDAVNSKIDTFGSIKGIIGTRVNSNAFVYFQSGIGFIKSSGYISETETDTHASLTKTIPSFVVGAGINYVTPINLYINVGVDYYIGKNYKIHDDNSDDVTIATQLFVPYIGLGYIF
jgi:opacity protein-like surface antigen